MLQQHIWCSPESLYKGGSSMYHETDKYVYKFCPRDGTPVKKEKQQCPTCGSPIPAPRNLSIYIWIGIILLTMLITYGLVMLNRYMNSYQAHSNSLYTSNWPFWFIGTGIILILLYQCVLRCIIRPWQLAQRCRYAVGKIVMTRYISGGTRGGGRWVSVIDFQTLTRPSLTVRILKRGKWHGKFDICYDYCQPFTNYRSGITSFSRASARYSTLIGIFLIFLLLAGQTLIVIQACNF